MKAGDCFYCKDLDLIFKVERLDTYGIIIESFGWCIHSLKYHDGVVFKSKALSSLSRGMYIGTWRETYTNLVSISPSILSKIVKLMNFNFITCQTLAKSFEDCDGASIFITDTRIDLDLGGDANCITRNTISYLENSRYLPIPSKHVTIKDYNLLLSRINNTVEQIDNILKSLKEGS